MANKSISLLNSTIKYLKNLFCTKLLWVNLRIHCKQITCKCTQSVNGGSSSNSIFRPCNIMGCFKRAETFAINLEVSKQQYLFEYLALMFMSKIKPYWLKTTRAFDIQIENLPRNSRCYWAFHTIAVKFGVLC